MNFAGGMTGFTNDLLVLEMEVTLGVTIRLRLMVSETHLAYHQFIMNECLLVWIIFYYRYTKSATPICNAATITRQYPCLVVYTSIALPSKHSYANATSVRAPALAHRKSAGCTAALPAFGSVLEGHCRCHSVPALMARNGHRRN